MATFASTCWEFLNSVITKGADMSLPMEQIHPQRGHFKHWSSTRDYVCSVSCCQEVVSRAPYTGYIPTLQTPGQLATGSRENALLHLPPFPALVSWSFISSAAEADMPTKVLQSTNYNFSHPYNYTLGLGPLPPASASRPLECLPAPWP